MFLVKIVGRLSKSKPIASSILEPCVQYLSKICKDLKEGEIAQESNIDALQNAFYVFFMIEEAISNANATLSQCSPNEELVCWINQFESLWNTETLIHLPPLMQQYALMLISKIDKTA